MTRARRPIATACCALVALVALVALLATASAREPRAPASPQEILRYRNSGEWNRDTTAVLRRAKRFVKQRLARQRPRRPAVVLDIDDTSLSLYGCLKAQNFALASAPACAVSASRPIRQTLGFFRYVRRRHVAVFFITGRPEGLRGLTEGRLRGAGYTGRWRLVLRPNTDHRPSVVPYKRGARRRITRNGYKILANLGDQRSDLSGGFALRGFKLPNPMYFTP
jgi:acid phosphatase